MKEYLTVSRASQTELIIKKSRFIGQLYPCESMEQAAELIASARKKYYDARHNCSAVIVGAGREYMKCSDDGEPSGTAGVPMLEALKQTGLTNTLAIVTRYFGGVLLGAGGLVRAYSASVIEAAKGAKKLLYTPREIYRCEFSFKQWSRAEKALAAYDIEGVEYGAAVGVTLAAQPGGGEALMRLLAELSGGGCVPELLGQRYAKIEQA